MCHAATQKFNQMHPIKCPRFFSGRSRCFKPCDLWSSSFSRLLAGPGTICACVCICLWVCVGGCVTECGTNERSDYSLKPRVIISSPWIKRQIKPTAGRGEADHVDICFYSGKVEKLQEFEEGRKRAAHLALRARCWAGCSTSRFKPAFPKPGPPVLFGL